jgi:hypothetical protein
MCGMTPVQREALARLNAAHEKRVALEIAECESVVSGEVIPADLRQSAGLALLHEQVARLWARQLGVEVAA